MSNKSEKESEKKERSIKRDTIHELIAANNGERYRKLNLSSSIVNYNLSEDILKKKLM